MKDSKETGKINATHGSGLGPRPENKMLNKSIMGIVGEIWIMSVDSVIINVKCSDVEHYIVIC